MLARALARERAVVLGGVAALTAMAWLELWRQHRGMAMDAAMPMASINSVPQNFPLLSSPPMVLPRNVPPAPPMVVARS